MFLRCQTSAQTYFSGAWRHDIISARFEDALEQARRLYSFTTRSRKTENDQRFRENRTVLFGPRLFQRCHTSEQTYFSGARRHDIISARFEADLEQVRRLSSFTTRPRKTENDHRFQENRHVLFGSWLFQRCKTFAQNFFSGAWCHDIIRARFEAALEQARRLSLFTTRTQKTENDIFFR